MTDNTHTNNHSVLPLEILILLNLNFFIIIIIIAAAITAAGTVITTHRFPFPPRFYAKINEKSKKREGKCQRFGSVRVYIYIYIRPYKSLSCDLEEISDRIFCHPLPPRQPAAPVLQGLSPGRQ